MNQSQINDFLKCLTKIDDLNYLLLHDQLKNENLKHDHQDEHNHDHDHDHDHSDDGHDLLVAKSTAMVVLFLASTLCGSIPFVLNRCFKWTDEKHAANTARSAVVIKSLLYFGGGVLLATTFLHLLPEVQEVVKVLQMCGTIKTLHFPLAEFLMCMGFCLMYLIEESLHTYIHRQNKRLTLDDNGSAAAAFRRGQSVRGSYLLRGSGHPNDGCNVEQLKYQQNEDSNLPLANSNTNASSLVTLSVDDLVQATKINEDKFLTHHQQQQHNHHHTHYHQHDHEDHEIICQSHNHGHSHLSATLQSSAPADNDVLASSLRGLFIVLALSLHELFEGMAIGLEGSASSVWFLFGAVSAHKLVLAFCVGVELIVARTRLCLSIIYILTFAVVSPLGIGIGILVSHNSSGNSTEPTMASALLQGLACGTLLYVVFFEILSKQHNGFIAYLALLVGFACMFGLQQLGNYKKKQYL